jgi:hypothetical protein
LIFEEREMKPMLNPKDQKAIHEFSTHLQQIYDQMRQELNKFCLNANKAAARRSRKFLMEMTRKAKELRNVIQEAKDNIISVEPLEYMTQIILENNDLASLQTVAKKFGLGGGLAMRSPKILAKRIAEHLIDNSGRTLEPEDEIGNLIRMAEKLDLRMGDLVGTSSMTR